VTGRPGPAPASPGRRAAHLAIRSYQLTLSALIGRQCRHWPSCSAYMDEAIQRHGVWAGGWIGVARLCRCHPWGTDGIDLVCEELPPGATAWTPWRYGRWRGTLSPPPLDEESPDRRASP
jgi:hypothetical protein